MEKGGLITMLFSNANKVLVKIRLWGEICRQRKQLSKMDDYLLKDIGLSRVDADREANRKFWDSSAVEDESLQRRTDATSNVSTKKTNSAFKLRFHQSQQ
jgi:uncharacterized protein YjiS (DUF1127 family)